MNPSPLQPPSLEESGEALASVAPLSLPWPTVFDTPEEVERVWTDFVAHQPPAVRTELRRALAFARARHGTQTRRGGDSPYWVHLVRVAMQLARWEAATPPLMSAALLHDVLEDTPTTPGELRAGFGDEVADLVDWLTCPPQKDDEGLRAYYAMLVAEGPPEAHLLKLADRVDNLRSIQALVMRTGDRYRRWAETYLARTRWQVLPLAAGAPSVARVDLITAMADLAPLVGAGDFTEP